MKKAIAMLLSATMIFSLAACGSTGQNTASEDSAPTAGQESESASDSGNERKGGCKDHLFPQQEQKQLCL